MSSGAIATQPLFAAIGRCIMGGYVSSDAHRDTIDRFERERDAKIKRLERDAEQKQAEQVRRIEDKHQRTLAEKAAKMEREKAQAVVMAKEQQEAVLAEIRQNAEREREELHALMAAQLEAQREQLEKERDEAVQRQRRVYSCPTYLKDIMNDKPNAIKIAFLGSTNQGKSSLVNELRGLRKTRATDGSMVEPDNWAEVGSGQTTMRTSAYSFISPEFPEQELLLFDCPGAGTPEFPSETYIADMGLKFFQGVVVLSAGVMTEITVQMVEDLKEHQIPFVFARTKIDETVEHEEHDNGRSLEETMERALQEVMCLGVNESDVYLISSRKSAWRRGYGCLEPFKAGIEQMVKLALTPIEEHRSVSEAGSNSSSLVAKMALLLEEADADRNAPVERPGSAAASEDDFEMLEDRGDAIRDTDDGQEMAHYYE